MFFCFFPGSFTKHLLNYPLHYKAFCPEVHPSCVAYVGFDFVIHSERFLLIGGFVLCASGAQQARPVWSYIERYSSLHGLCVLPILYHTPVF